MKYLPKIGKYLYIFHKKIYYINLKKEHDSFRLAMGITCQNTCKII